MKVKPVCIALGCLLIASSCDKERRPSTPGELETATAESLYGSLLSKSPRGYTNSNSTSASVSEDFGDLVLLPGKNLCGYVRDSEGNGLAGITVSDGYSCVSTNADGEYQMTANPAARTVSITVPAACEIPLGAHNQPAFWQPVVIPASGAVKKDFILKARADGVPSRFTILAVTDEHVQSENMLTKFVIPMLDIQNTARTLLSSGIPVGTPAHADAGEVVYRGSGADYPGGLPVDRDGGGAYTGNNSTHGLPPLRSVAAHIHDPGDLRESGGDILEFGRILDFERDGNHTEVEPGGAGIE